MSIIKDVITEELKRLKTLEKKYFREIHSLPKGAISKKVRNGNFYLYLTYRENRKVVSKYVGSWNSERAKSVIKQIEQRKKLEDKLKNVRRNLRELERVLSGKKI